MTAVWRSSAHTSAVLGAAIVVSKPSGVTSGDLLIAHATGGGNAQPPGGTGWNTLSGGVSGNRIFWKIAGGSEPSTYSFSQDALQTSVVSMHRFDGHDSTTPISSSWASRTENDPTPAQLPSITPPVASCLLAVFTQASNTAMSPPGSMTERYDSNDGNGFSVSVADEVLSSTSATGTRDFSPANNGNTTAYMLAIQPGTVSQTVDAVTATATAQADASSLSLGASVDAVVATATAQADASVAGAGSDVAAVTATATATAQVPFKVASGPVHLAHNYNSAGGGGTSTMTFVKPDGCQVGDLLVIGMLATGTLTPPAGWTLDYDSLNAYRVYYARVDGTTITAADDGQTFQFIDGGSAVYYLGFIHHLRHTLATGNPFDGVGADNYINYNGTGPQTSAPVATSTNFDDSLAILWTYSDIWLDIASSIPSGLQALPPDPFYGHASLLEMDSAGSTGTLQHTYDVAVYQTWANAVAVRGTYNVSQEVFAPEATATATAQVPVVAASQAVDAATATATATAQVPEVAAHLTINAVLAEAQASALVPDVISGQIIYAVTAEATAQADAPTVDSLTVIEAPTATAGAQAYSPEVVGHVEIEPPAAAATATAQVPTVSGELNAVVEPPAAFAYSIPDAPTVSGGATVSAVTATATASAPTPSTGINAQVMAVTATATCQGHAPEQSASAVVTAICATASGRAWPPRVNFVARNYHATARGVERTRRITLVPRTISIEEIS